MSITESVWSVVSYILLAHALSIITLLHVRSYMHYLSCWVRKKASAPPASPSDEKPTTLPPSSWCLLLGVLGVDFCDFAAALAGRDEPLLGVFPSLEAEPDFRDLLADRVKSADEFMVVVGLHDHVLDLGTSLLITFDASSEVRTGTTGFGVSASCAAYSSSPVSSRCISIARFSTASSWAIRARYCRCRDTRIPNQGSY